MHSFFLSLFNRVQLIISNRWSDAVCVRSLVFARLTSSLVQVALRVYGPSKSSLLLPAYCNILQWMTAAIFGCNASDLFLYLQLSRVITRRPVAINPKQPTCVQFSLFLNLAAVAFSQVCFAVREFRCTSLVLCTLPPLVRHQNMTSPLFWLFTFRVFFEQRGSRLCLRAARVWSACAERNVPLAVSWRGSDIRRAAIPLCQEGTDPVWASVSWACFNRALFSPNFFPPSWLLSIHAICFGLFLTIKRKTFLHLNDIILFIPRFEPHVLSAHIVSVLIAVSPSAL